MILKPRSRLKLLNRTRFAEVRNAGWTKFNSTELQVGSKCLILIEGKEDDLDRANNNAISAKENLDNNGNNSKAVPRTKRAESSFYSGHIQEMNKSEGPVVVFIEELGEKRIVPFSALKPFPLRKGRPTNWGIAARKNSFFNQS